MGEEPAAGEIGHRKCLIFNFAIFIKGFNVSMIKGNMGRTGRLFFCLNLGN